MKKCWIILSLALCTTLFAQDQKERTRPEAPIERTAALQRDAAPLMYALPTLGANAATLEIRILQGKRQLVSELVKLPEHVTFGAAVDVLVTHPDQLNRLRSIESETPGSLRFISRVDGRVLTDEPFANIEAASAGLSVESAIGQATQVEVRATPKLRIQANGIGKDPACAEQCDAQLAACLDWCDPRGDSCNQCYSWHYSCWSLCDNVCYEPKAESDYTIKAQINAVANGNTCHIWTYTKYFRTYEIDHFHRVTHCDDSYTDTFTGTTYTTDLCYVNTHNSCSPSTAASVPSPQC
ncbi:MAG: hypothetical protein JOZ54_00265 [Acidobacteria bacterium]|nr:hypothetical protein [Acidobacteriota bacterium]